MPALHLSDPTSRRLESSHLSRKRARGHQHAQHATAGAYPLEPHQRWCPCLHTRHARPHHLASLHCHTHPALAAARMAPLAALSTCSASPHARYPVTLLTAVLPPRHTPTTPETSRPEQKRPRVQKGPTPEVRAAPGALHLSRAAAWFFGHRPYWTSTRVLDLLLRGQDGRQRYIEGKKAQQRI